MRAYKKIEPWPYWLTDPPLTIFGVRLPEKTNYVDYFLVSGAVWIHVSSTVTKRCKNSFEFRLNIAKHFFEVATQLRFHRANSFLISSHVKYDVSTAFSLNNHLTHPYSPIFQYHFMDFIDDCWRVDLFWATWMVGITWAGTTTTELSTSLLNHWN